MEQDDHYYVEGYSAQTDPYALENGVLKNNFGITDSASLNEIEADLAAIQIQGLLEQAPPGTFTPEHLCKLHEQVFSQVYPWAGKQREVDIAKGDTHFLKHQQIASQLAELFSQLADVNFLKGSIFQFRYEPEGAGFQVTSVGKPFGKYGCLSYICNFSLCTREYYSLQSTHGYDLQDWQIHHSG
jgi:hypothetical protein